MVDKPFLLSQCPTVGEYLTCFMMQNSWGLVAAWCMSGFFTCFLGRPVPPFDLDWSISQDLGFQGKTGSVSGKLLTHFLRGLLALLSGLFETGRLEYVSVSPLLRIEHHNHPALEHKPGPLNILLPVLTRVYSRSVSSLPMRPLKILAVTTDN